jgi:hypothetical protein
MNQGSWLFVFVTYIALQIPLGMLVGSFCAAGEEEDHAFAMKGWTAT